MLVCLFHRKECGDVSEDMGIMNISQLNHSSNSRQGI